MNEPNDSTVKHCLVPNEIEQLLAENEPFALYRLPWETSCRLVRPDSGRVEEFSSVCRLGEVRGFVFAPFQPGEECPLLLMRSEAECLLSLPPYQSRQEAVLTMPHADGKEEYDTAFSRFVDELRQGCFRKLVLSRRCRQRVVGSFSLINSFLEACSRYPRMMIYVCHTPQAGTWMGCTPEILLEGMAKQWHTVALAGTMPVGCVSGVEEWSRKNREEQRLVSEYLHEQLRKAEIEAAEEGPYMAQAGPLVHLKSDFRFTLPKQEGAVGRLLELLHPTPAVCGLPKEQAWRYIPRNEGYCRGYYSGFLGRLDVTGETHLYVNLRCAKVTGAELDLYAGGGILPQSDRQREWEETEQKMNTVRSILRQER